MKFEDNLTKLEEIANLLEKNELPLEEALQEFKKGVQLISASQKIIDKAELEIKLITEKQGKIIEEDYDNTQAED